MITEHDLQEAIAECEGQRNPNANTCLKLASLYIIRDKMFHVEREPNFYSAQSKERNVMEEKIERRKDDSEFRQAIVGTDLNKVIEIMDELMSTLKIISPRLYNGVLKNLKTGI